MGTGCQLANAGRAGASAVTAMTAATATAATGSANLGRRLKRRELVAPPGIRAGSVASTLILNGSKARRMARGYRSSSMIQFLLCMTGVAQLLAQRIDRAMEMGGDRSRGDAQQRGGLLGALIEQDPQCYDLALPAG